MKGTCLYVLYKYIMYMLTNHSVLENVTEHSVL